MRLVALTCPVLLAGAALAQPPAPPAGLANWSFDEITLQNGAKFQGLLLAEGPDGFRFRHVSRPPGRPTITLTDNFTRAEVKELKRLPEAERALLKERLADLDPSGEGERKRMDSLELVSKDWPGKPGAARRYESEYFFLESTGSEELTRRSAVRLEQVYTAFARFLPPAVKDARPTRIMLATDRDEYKALLGPVGEALLLNPAVYDRANNQVLCGHDLRELGTRLQTARIHHSQELARLDKYEGEVRKLYPPPELNRYLGAVRAERNRVFAGDRENGARFDRATAAVFAVLYHEAFHAYATTFVYPPLPPEAVKAGKGPGELPRWLNEGLAQVFETSVVEAGELRADTPDKERLARVKDGLKGKGGTALVPLGDLLTTNRDAFLASHADQKAAANRAYLSSWALAYYLTFGKRVIGTEAFRKYLVAVNTGGDPRQAFAALVGKDAAAFEKDWHAYLLKLNPDGTLAK
ncbi:Uncharacterized protein OS=Pirellula staleyi (strain ATCC 27377 / DSM 6068 / ICPB 4128) GN=Psta_3816 PE=4 SV=1: Peptidase_MA_2 [Gemmataceae bacterium]|nr:Uncharacterized protein OS=Pirellula staleyi (strain ATCC 27377 / DSM 6068 / ICPB 4128) GN=Psta_3816 PE=4 SV=1: Peptidase_MA_2 [Gemmataceae bacterium]VTT97813.1 Uncharacterized protein OS=Pirellula staleyi (strain ATCC 27377 / DSM 6068 / ICPB 4128) GN=Psta_3816 PE=4 SV=1: Peptidase_MA_2 [Gemmataceae bacterium]